jgi:peptidase E/ribosomal protein S18 acetylase RimI-like enzyme
MTSDESRWPQAALGDIRRPRALGRRVLDPARAGGPSVILLTSLELPATMPLDLSHVLFVPAAAADLDDRDDIVAALRKPLVDGGAKVVDLDLDRDTTVDASVLARCTAVACAGGDPFRLLRAMRRSGFDRVLSTARDRVDYVGMSAGAAVAGPSLAPLLGVSPFRSDDDESLDALALTGLVTLAHDDRPGRRPKHESAMRAHGRTHSLLPLTDSEVAFVDAATWEILDVRSGMRSRPARREDADGIAATYAAAGRRAWTFLGDDQLATLEDSRTQWDDRLAARARPDDVLVAVDDAGIAGFVWIHAARNTDLPGGTGEIGAFYTHPRCWGTGTGRRLLTRALDQLRCQGYDDAILYTEERNARARRVYERFGWVLDGAARERDFHGAHLRELRYRITL